MKHKQLTQITSRGFRGISPFMPRMNLSWGKREALWKALTYTKCNIFSAGGSHIGRSACSAMAEAAAEVKTESGGPSGSCTTDSSRTQVITSIPQSFADNVGKTDNLARAALSAATLEQRSRVRADSLRLGYTKILPAQNRRLT